MSNRQKTGGIAALVEAATFVVGFALFGTVLADYTTGDPDAGESVAFLVDNQAVLYVWNAIIFIVFGIFLVVLALALHERLKVGARALTQTATAFGMIWAGLVIAAGMVANIGWSNVVDLHDSDPERAESLWLAVDSVHNGLGGGNEIVGGLWVLLVSWAALRSGLLPRALNYLGLVIGVAGLVTIVPALEMVGAVFGLGLIVWFVWLGFVLLSDHTSDPDHIDVNDAAT
jgi:hypothetical protein